MTDDIDLSTLAARLDALDADLHAGRIGSLWHVRVSCRASPRGLALTAPSLAVAVRKALDRFGAAAVGESVEGA